MWPRNARFTSEKAGARVAKRGGSNCKMVYEPKENKTPQEPNRRRTFPDRNPRTRHSAGFGSLDFVFSLFIPAVYSAPPRRSRGTMGVAPTGTT